MEAYYFWKKQELIIQKESFSAINAHFESDFGDKMQNLLYWQISGLQKEKYSLIRNY